HPLQLCSFVITDPPTTEIYTLSLHDALPISKYEHVNRKNKIELGTQETVDIEVMSDSSKLAVSVSDRFGRLTQEKIVQHFVKCRSEEHTSELQSRENLVCRLLLEKKKTQKRK